MQNKLVSLLTPMYNTEKYVHRLLDSVLAQDYPDIEMIVIDDGSTDGSRAKVESYVERFRARGYTLKCVHQENAGQSVAIKNGLPLVSGEYLAWPDSDDFYSADNAISKMVKVLEDAGPEFQMVRTQEILVEDETLKPLKIVGLDAHEEEDRSLFEDCLFYSNGFYYCSGAYMIRTAVLYDLTDFDIYTEKNAGQNWQLMLPVLYKYRCRTILEPLYTVVSRSSSHSRGQSVTYEQIVRQYESYYNTRVETLKRIKGFPEESIPDYQNRLRIQRDRILHMYAVRKNNRAAALATLYACEGEISSPVMFMRKALLHVKGITYPLNAYRKFHHFCFLVKNRLKSCKQDEA